VFSPAIDGAESLDRGAIDYIDNNGKFIDNLLESDYQKY
jgi:hypothetical protein